MVGWLDGYFLPATLLKKKKFRTKITQNLKIYHHKQKKIENILPVQYQQIFWNRTGLLSLLSRNVGLGDLESPPLSCYLPILCQHANLLNSPQ